MKKQNLIQVLAIVAAVAFGIPAVSGEREVTTVTQAGDDAETLGGFGYDRKPTVGTRVKCPVMVGKIKVRDDTPFSKYKGKWYGFCCPDCKGKFDADPEKYLAACPEDCPCPD